MSDVDYRAMWMEAASELDDMKRQRNILAQIVGDSTVAAGITEAVPMTIVELSLHGGELVTLLESMKKDLTVVHVGSLRGHQFLDQLRREFGRTGRAGDEIVVQTDGGVIYEITGIQNVTNPSIVDDYGRMKGTTWILVEPVE